MCLLPIFKCEKPITSLSEVNARRSFVSGNTSDIGLNIKILNWCSEGMSLKEEKKKRHREFYFRTNRTVCFGE